MKKSSIATKVHYSCPKYYLYFISNIKHKTLTKLNLNLRLKTCSFCEPEEKEEDLVRGQKIYFPEGKTVEALLLKKYFKMVLCINKFVLK